MGVLPMPPLPANAPYSLQQFPQQDDGLFKCELKVHLPNGRIQIFHGSGTSPAKAWIQPHFQASFQINMICSGVDEALDSSPDHQQQHDTQPDEFTFTASVSDEENDPSHPVEQSKQSPPLHHSPVQRVAARHQAVGTATKPAPQSPDPSADDSDERDVSSSDSPWTSHPPLGKKRREGQPLSQPSDNAEDQLKPKHPTSILEFSEARQQATTTLDNRATSPSSHCVRSPSSTPEADDDITPAPRNRPISSPIKRKKKNTAPAIDPQPSARFHSSPEHRRRMSSQNLASKILGVLHIKEDATKQPVSPVKNQSGGQMKTDSRQIKSSVLGVVDSVMAKIGNKDEDASASWERALRSVSKITHLAKKGGIGKSKRLQRKKVARANSMGKKRKAGSIPNRKGGSSNDLPTVSFAPAKNQTPDIPPLKQSDEPRQNEEQYNASTPSQNQFISDMPMPAQNQIHGLMNPMGMTPGLPFINGGADMSQLHAMNNMMRNQPHPPFMQTPHGPVPINAPMMMNPNAVGGMMPMNGMYPMNAMNGMNYMSLPMNPMLPVNGMMGQYPYPNLNGMPNGMPPNLHEQQLVDRAQMPSVPGINQHCSVAEIETTLNVPRSNRSDHFKKRDKKVPRNADLKKDSKGSSSIENPSTGRGRKRLNRDEDVVSPEKDKPQGTDAYRGNPLSTPCPENINEKEKPVSPDYQSDEESDGEDYVSHLHLICQKDISCARPSFKTRKVNEVYNGVCWECIVSVNLPKGKYKASQLVKTVLARSVKKARQKGSKELLLALKELSSEKKKAAESAKPVVKKTAPTPEPPVVKISKSTACAVPTGLIREKLSGIRNYIAALLQLFHWEVLLHQPDYDFEELGGGKQGQWRCTLILTVRGFGVEKVFHDGPQKKASKGRAAQKGFERLRELKILEVDCFENVQMTSLSPQREVEKEPDPVSPTFAKSLVQISDEEESVDEDLEKMEEFETKLLLPKHFKLVIPLSDDECEQWINEHVKPGGHLGLFCDSWSAQISFRAVETMGREAQEMASPQFPLLCLSTATSAMVIRGGNMFVREDECENTKGSGGFWLPQKVAEVLADHRVLKHGHSLDQGLMTLRTKYGMHARGVNDIAVSSFAVAGFGGVAGNRIISSLGELVGHWLKKDVSGITGKGIWSSYDDAPKEMGEAGADGLAVAALSSYACLRVREQMVGFSEMRCAQNFGSVIPQFDELCSRLLNFH